MGGAGASSPGAMPATSHEAFAPVRRTEPGSPGTLAARHLPGARSWSGTVLFLILAAPAGWPEGCSTRERPARAAVRHRSANPRGAAEEDSMPIWNADLAVGVPDIDAQHQELFRRADALLAAMKERQPADREVERLFLFLDEYCSRHFASEERLMREKKYRSRSSRGSARRVRADVPDRRRAVQGPWRLGDGDHRHPAARQRLAGAPHRRRRHEAGPVPRGPVLLDDALSDGPAAPSWNGAGPPWRCLPAGAAITVAPGRPASYPAAAGPAHAGKSRARPESCIEEPPRARTRTAQERR